MAVLKVPPRISTGNWPQYLSWLMNELTHNFAVLME
jgi:hypothetical protein